MVLYTIRSVVFAELFSAKTIFCIYFFRNGKKQNRNKIFEEMFSEMFEFFNGAIFYLAGYIAQGGIGNDGRFFDRMIASTFNR